MKVRITFLDAPSDRHGVSGHDFDLTPIEAQDLLETARSMAAHSSAAPLRLRDAAEPQSREEAISKGKLHE